MSILKACDLAIKGVFSAINLEVSAGECWGIVGGNGAGKSTLLATLAGALRPDHGELLRPAVVAWMPESWPLDPGITGRSWVGLLARLPGWDATLAQRIQTLLPFPLDSSPEHLSLGQRTRLGLLLSLPRRLPLLLLDDPFLGLDPEARAITQQVISDVAGPDHAILIATADLGSALRLCTHLARLEQGGPLRGAEISVWEQQAAKAEQSLEALLSQPSKK